MKKTFLTVLCLVLCFCSIFTLTACQSNTPGPEETTPAGNESTPEATEDPTPEPTPEPTEDPAAGVSGTVAHWKFQNDSKYFSGSLNDSDLKFNDLTGNGNTLEVKVEGEGNKFDVFSWDDGANIGYQGTSSLNFGNTLKNAKNVCPSEYKGSNMDYTGGTYVSGKYFATVQDAPMNDDDFSNGYTMEVIFKIDKNFKNDYNRYAGLFSRQGLVGNEPWFSMALAEGSSSSLGLQLVQSGIGAFQPEQNVEHSQIKANEWVHYMAVANERGEISFYINGKKCTESAVCSAGIGSSGFGWEVGVGRKDFTDRTDVKNPMHPEGGIRRLFTGTISEIRVIDHAISIEDSLYNKPVNN